MSIIQKNHSLLFITIITFFKQMIKTQNFTNKKEKLNLFGNPYLCGQCQEASSIKIILLKVISCWKKS